MRRLLVAGLVGVFALVVASTTGCGSDDQKTQIPDKTINLPKEGPKAAGGGGDKPAGQPPAPPSNSSQ